MACKDKASCSCQKCQATRDAEPTIRFYITEQLSPKRSETPEGYLVCHDVPIGRTGTMDYVEDELPSIEGKDGVIIIERTPDEVFRPETIASFEGKPVTIDHPDEFVTPETWKELSVGITLNVHQGEGEQNDLLLADLLITDSEAIRMVRLERPEISSGYDAAYEQVSPGRGVQRNIIGNHVAIVKRGRCGPVCSIGDSQMAGKKPAPQSFKDKLRKLFNTRDSEEFEKTLEAMDEGGDGQDGGETHVHVHLNGAAGEAPNGGGEGATGNSSGTQDDEPIAQLTKAVTDLTAMVKGIDDRLTKVEKGGSTSTGDEETEEERVAREERERQERESQGGQTTDSTSLRDEFQEARAGAEILAPGIQLPTFDAKAKRKATFDSICELRRRALSKALDNGNAEIVKTVTGGADVKTMDCASVKGLFIAATAMVKNKNKNMYRDSGHQHQEVASTDLNEVNKNFWAKH